MEMAIETAEAERAAAMEVVAPVAAVLVATAREVAARAATMAAAMAEVKEEEMEAVRVKVGGLRPASRVGRL